MPGVADALCVGFLERVNKILGYSVTSSYAGGMPGNLFSPSAGLAPIIYKDLGFSGAGLPATVLEAMKVPSIARAVALYATAISTVTPDDNAPAWLYGHVGSITPAARLVSITQDLLFFRESCLLVERDSTGTITQAIRLPYEMWSLDLWGNVLISGAAVDQSTVVYISSLLPLGLLEAAADTIHHYLDLNNTIRSRGRNPVPLVELHITDDFEGTTAELAETQKNWSAARQAEDGAVAFTPKGIELKTPGANAAGDSSMLIEARNAVRLDVANFCNINAALLEGANGASGTYENTLQTKDEFVTLSCNTWLNPIAARLSAPDCSPAPWTFNTAELAGTDPKGNIGRAIPRSPQLGELQA